MARTGPGGPTESEPYSEEALQYTKELCLQREVSVTILILVLCAQLGQLFLLG